MNVLGLKMAEISFFQKNSFFGVAWGLYHRIIQKLLELELSLKICYSGTFWRQTLSLSVIVHPYVCYES